MLRITLLFITLLLSQFTYAAPEITPEAIPQNLHIYSESGSAFVTVTGHGCSGSQYIIPNNHVRYEAIFSLILAAQVSGKPIRLRFDGCSANNQGIVVGAYLK